VNGTWGPYDNAEEPKTEIFSFYGHSAVLLDDGVTMVIFGGVCSTNVEDAGFCNYINLVNITSGNSTLLAPTGNQGENWPNPRAFHSAVYANGMMYVTGGVWSINAYEFPFDQYDWSTIYQTPGDVSRS
jgi:hypothetical protein